MVKKVATKKTKKVRKSEAAEDLKTTKKRKTKAAAEASKKTKKTATKKTAAKKTTKAAKPTKKAAGAKTAKAKKPDASNLPKPIKTKMTKTQLMEHLAEQSGVDKKDVKKVMESLEQTMIASIRKKGLGEFMFPGMFKIVTKHIPAKKGGEKKISFGREIITKAKPATTKVKIRPMKKAKDAALV